MNKIKILSFTSIYVYYFFQMATKQVESLNNNF